MTVLYREVSIKLEKLFKSEKWKIHLCKFRPFSSFLASACTWLPVFQHSVWHDSDKGELTFTDAEMFGWTVAAGGGQVRSDWDCFYHTKYATHDIVIYKYASLILQCLSFISTLTMAILSLGFMILISYD